jgi:uncharacterized repeat protein (TIGR02543 family)
MYEYVFERWMHIENLVTFEIQDQASSLYGDFVPQSAFPVPSPQIVASGKKATKPTNPVSSGVSFVYWSVDEPYVGEGASISKGYSCRPYNFNLPVTESVKLYARWSNDCDIEHYIVTFNSQGGSFVESKNVAFESTVAVPTTPTRTGYAFAGWYTLPTGDVKFDFSTKITTDTTIYAHWTELPKYTATFNSRGGTAIKPQIIYKGTSATQPTNPTRVGYTFAGWFTSATGNVRFNFATKITTDTTIYAHWTPIPRYTITLKSQGGSSVKSQTVYYSTTAKQPLAPTRTDYTFAGWYTKATGGSKFNFATKIAKNTTLYAHWVAKSKKLTQKHSDYKSKFKDISKLNSSRQSAIQWMYRYEITTGSPAGSRTYKPNGKVNRGAMAQFMHKLKGSLTTYKSTPTIKDISKLAKDRQSDINWLAAEGITVLSNGKYNPNNSVNRGAMAEFLYKLAGSPKFTPSKSDYAKIKDLNKVGNNAGRKKAIAWLVKKNITVLSNGKYNPQNAVNRGSMAEFLQKLS